MNFYNVESCKELIIIVIKGGPSTFFFFFLSSFCGDFSTSFHPACCHRCHDVLQMVVGGVFWLMLQTESLKVHCGPPELKAPQWLPS